MDKVQKHNSFNTNTQSSESYKNEEISSSIKAENFLTTWISMNFQGEFCTAELVSYFNGEFIFINLVIIKYRTQYYILTKQVQNLFPQNYKS